LAVAAWVQTLRHRPYDKGDDGLEEMEKFYKDHRIEISGWLDNDEWFVSVFITYHEQGKNILVTLPLNEQFSTYSQAVIAGFSAAQRWIDEANEP
jgi:hypothetical protein